MPKLLPFQIDTLTLGQDIDLRTGIYAGLSLDSLNDSTITTPLNGEVLTYNSSTNQWENTTQVAGVTDHLLLSNIGINSHAALDSHITGSALQHLATAISYDDTNIDLQGSGTIVDNAQLAIEKLDLKRRFKNTTHTGVITGGFITSPSPTTFSISDGSGAILDQALTPSTATGVLVEWTGLTNITLTQDVSGFGGTYIFITSTGTVAQFIAKPPTSTFINNVFLGVIFYEASAITTVFNEPNVVDSTAINFSDYVNFHDSNNHHGVTPIAIGAGDPNSVLEFYVTDGELFAEGINWHNDKYNPNILQIAGLGTDTTGAIPWGAGATFDYILGDGTVFASNQTILDETIYDDGTSVPGTTPTGDGVIHFIIYTPSNQIYVQPFTQTYRDWKAANSSVQAALSNFVLAPSIQEGTIIGAYVGQEDTNSWERGDRSSITGFSTGFAPGTPSGSGGAISATWGSITGTLSAQTDLQSSLDSKVNLAGDTMTGPLSLSSSVPSLNIINPTLAIDEREWRYELLPVSGGFGDTVLRIGPYKDNGTPVMSNGILELKQKTTQLTWDLMEVHGAVFTDENIQITSQGCYLRLTNGNLFTGEPAILLEPTNTNVSAKISTPYAGSYLQFRVVDGTGNQPAEVQLRPGGNLSINTVAPFFPDDLTRKDYVDNKSQFIDLSIVGTTVTNNTLPSGWSTSSSTPGEIVITHNLNNTEVGFALSVLHATIPHVVNPTSITANTITIRIADTAGTLQDGQVVGRLLF